MILSDVMDVHVYVIHYYYILNISAVSYNIKLKHWDKGVVNQAFPQFIAK